MMNLMQKILLLIRGFKPGDWIIIIFFLFFILMTIKFFLNFPDGQYLKIQKNSEILGIYSLNQQNIKIIKGLRGVSEIVINNGKVRFTKAPCNKQYCIHQGWISKINQMIVCIPNQISISIIGDKETHDSINY